MPRQLSWWVPAVQALLTPMTARQRRRSAVEQFARVEAEAARKSGVPGPVDEPFRGEMLHLYQELLAMDGLSAMGWVAVRSEVARRLENRLRVTRALAERPAIAEQPVERPIFVVGLPRTGTTLLHGLLGADPRHRAPLLWELLCPTPQDVPAAELDRRVGAGRTMATMAARTAPKSASIHAMAATDPEECFFLLPHTMGYRVRGPMPGYHEWFTRRDATADYAYHKQQLQALQWAPGGPGALSSGEPPSGPAEEPRRWVLKSPLHLWKLDALLSVYPDAVIVWPHRDPVTVLGSWCSLATTGELLHLRHVDRERIGRDWLELWAEAVATAMRVRERTEATFVDVSYPDLVANPLDTVADIYERAGIELTDEAREAVAAWLRRNQAERQQTPPHDYDLADYGLDADAVHDAFAGYLDTFPAPRTLP